MSDDSRSVTRRSALASIALALVGAGCSSRGTQTTQRQPDGASTPGSMDDHSPHGSGEHEHHDATELIDPSDDPLGAFEQRLERQFVPVKSISSTDNRVQLSYVAQSERSHEVAAGIEAVVISFLRVYNETDDWAVEGVDVTVLDRHDSAETMGYWRLETEWVTESLTEERTRTELLEQTLASYRGELRDPDHHDGEDPHHHSVEDDHTHESDTESDHDHPTTTADAG